jgi:hypothetical protein
VSKLPREIDNRYDKEARKESRGEQPEASDVINKLVEGYDWKQALEESKGKSSTTKQNGEDADQITKETDAYSTEEAGLDPKQAKHLDENGPCPEVAAGRLKDRDEKQETTERSSDKDPPKDTSEILDRLVGEFNWEALRQSIDEKPPDASPQLKQNTSKSLTDNSEEQIANGTIKETSPKAMDNIQEEQKTIRTGVQTNEPELFKDKENPTQKEHADSAKEMHQTLKDSYIELKAENLNNPNENPLNLISTETPELKPIESHGSDDKAHEDTLLNGTQKPIKPQQTASENLNQKETQTETTEHIIQTDTAENQGINEKFDGEKANLKPHETTKHESESIENSLHLAKADASTSESLTKPIEAESTEAKLTEIVGKPIDVRALIDDLYLKSEKPCKELKLTKELLEGFDRDAEFIADKLNRLGKFERFKNFNINEDEVRVKMTDFGLKEPKESKTLEALYRATVKVEELGNKLFANFIDKLPLDSGDKIAVNMDGSTFERRIAMRDGYQGFSITSEFAEKSRIKAKGEYEIEIFKHSGDERVKLTEEFLKELYTNQRLSLAEIAEITGWTYVSVLYRMEKYGIERRSVSEASMIYPKTPFSGDLVQMACYYGLVEGDVSARANGRQIHVSTGTTHPSMIELFRDEFGKDKHVGLYPNWGEGRPYGWRVDANMHPSYSFLLDKQKEKEFFEQTAGNEKLLLAFTARLVDCEGTLEMRNKYGCISRRLIICMENKDLLTYLQKNLAKYGYHSTLHIEAKKGTEKTYGICSEDFQRLVFFRQDEVLRLVEKLPLKHYEKVRRKKLMLAFKDHTRWNDIEPHIKTLREQLKKERDQCVEEAKKAWIKKHGEQKHSK